MARAKKTPNFEQAFAELEELVLQMESGELELEHSLAAFEKGIQLTRDCQTALSKAEQKVKMLLQEHGELKTVDFDVDELVDDADD